VHINVNLFGDVEMESDHVIDKDVIIERADIDRIYDGCLRWLKEINAKIKEKGDDHILAEHKGSVRYQGWWFRNKTINITLKKIEENVHVRLVMDPIYEKFQPKGFGIKYLKRYWVDLIVHLWTYIGVNVDKKILYDLYPYSILERRVDAFKFSFFAFLGIIIFLGIPLIWLIIELKFQGFIALMLVILFGYSLGRMIDYRYKQNPLKLMRELYPDYYKDKNKWIFLLLSRFS
jgi:hypothetical protein